jgi:hypothetical protein
VGVISNIQQQWRIVAVLANSPSFTHNSQIGGFGGIMLRLRESPSARDSERQNDLPAMG